MSGSNTAADGLEVPMFKIGDFSKLSRISIRMLRHYDAIGLLNPQQTDKFTGYRYYTAQQLVQAARIVSLRSMGFGLDAIAQLIGDGSGYGLVQSRLEEQARLLRGQLETLRGQIALIESALQRIKEDEENMKYDVSLKEFKEKKVMALRSVIPRYEDEGSLWQKMYAEVATQNVKMSAPAFCAAVFYDEGFQEHDVDVEVRAEVVGEYQNTEHVRFFTAEPVTAATVILKGDFSHVSDVCAAVGEWIAASGFEMAGPMFNIYHVSPAQDPNPEHWVTEVCFPVVKC